MSNENPGLIYMRDAKNTEIVLKVKRENITTERNFKINEQEMYSNKGKHHTTNFHHNGDDGLSFTVTALFVNDINYSIENGKLTGKSTINNNYETAEISNSEYQRYTNDMTSFKQLDSWYTQLHSFTIVFGKLISLKLPLVSKKWIVSKFNVKQETDTLIECDITFRTYNPPKQIKKVKNELVNRTSKSYKWTNNCKKHIKNLNYKKQSKKKFPKSDCVKLLNSIMIELSYMRKSKKTVKTGKKDKKGKDKTKKVKYVPNTWVHGKKAKKKTGTTSGAIRKFKKEWNKHKLKPALKKTKKGKYDDTIDKNTFKAIGNYKKLKSAKKKK